MHTLDPLAKNVQIPVMTFFNLSFWVEIYEVSNYL